MTGWSPEVWEIHRRVQERFALRRISERLRECETTGEPLPILNPKKEPERSQKLRRCCKTTKGKGLHNPGCPNAYQNKKKAKPVRKTRRKHQATIARAPLSVPGRDIVEDSDDPDFIILCDCVVNVETEKAILVDHDGEEHWIPKSQLRYPEDCPRGHEGAVEVREWFARKEEMF